MANNRRNAAAWILALFWFIAPAAAWAGEPTLVLNVLGSRSSLFQHYLEAVISSGSYN